MANKGRAPIPINPLQEVELKAIIQGENHTEKLKKFAEKYDIKMSTLYGIWNRIHGQYQSIKKVGTKPKSTSKIIPYVIEKGIADRGRSDAQTIRALKGKLKPLIRTMEVYDGIPIYRVNARVVRRWLNESFKRKTFQISAIPEDKDMVRIIRRS